MLSFNYYVLCLFRQNISQKHFGYARVHLVFDFRRFCRTLLSHFSSEHKICTANTLILYICTFICIYVHMCTSYNNGLCK